MLSDEVALVVGLGVWKGLPIVVVILAIVLMIFLHELGHYFGLDEDRLAELDPRHGLLSDVPTSTLAAPETENWLFTAADQFPGPYRDIVEVRRRIQMLAAEIDAETVLGDVELAQGPPLRPDVSSLRSHEFDHDGVTIRETYVRINSL